MATPKTYSIGVLRGEGVGPVAVDQAVLLLKEVFRRSRSELNVKYGPEQGQKAAEIELKSICDYFRVCVNTHTPMLTGPLTTGIVYTVRKKFDLFYKLVPIQSIFPCGKLNAKAGVDILLIRQNNSGMFFGKEDVKQCKDKFKKIKYVVSFNEQNLIRLAEIAYEYANKRRKKISLALKKDGFPCMASIWMQAFDRIGARYPGVSVECVNTDRMAGELISVPQEYDVVVTPNLEGDMLTDMMAAYIFGSRNIGYSGNFNSNNFANYQTAHGAALDLKNKQYANPLGQILASAMLLEYSFGMASESRGIKKAVTKALSKGYRTADMRSSDKQKLVNAEEMTQVVLDNYAPTSH